MDTNKIELEIVALSHSVAQSHSYAVVLGEKDGSRRLPIVIGAFEAQAIAVAMEGVLPNRPLTHDLLRNMMDVFTVELKEIVINKLKDGIFYSKLICLRDNDVFEIDSRTSDALALSVRFNCPIYTFSDILEQAGIVLEEGSPEPERKKRRRSKPVEPERGLPEYSMDELEDLLQAALGEEKYERAAEIRDELNRRQEQG